MIAFFVALVLWIIGGGPAPALHGLTVPPAAPAPAVVAPRPPAVVPPARRAPRSETHRPPAAPPTVAAGPAEPAQPSAAPPALATTDVDPSDGRMCTDPIDCPPGR
jgi:hypothetical protein